MVCALTLFVGEIKTAAFVFCVSPNRREIPDLTGLATLFGLRLVDRCNSGNSPITRVGLRDYRGKRGEEYCVCLLLGTPRVRDVTLD
jgi:hypothetical protein